MEQNPFQSFTVDKVTATDSENTYVQATLYYGPGAGFPRIFQVSTRDGGIWRIFNVALPATPAPTAVPPTAAPPTIIPPTQGPAYPAPADLSGSAGEAIGS
jgi:hypothetical protein